MTQSKKDLDDCTAPLDYVKPAPALVSAARPLYQPQVDDNLSTAPPSHGAAQVCRCHVPRGPSPNPSKDPPPNDSPVSHGVPLCKHPALRVVARHGVIPLAIEIRGSF